MGKEQFVWWLGIFQWGNLLGEWGRSNLFGGWEFSNGEVDGEGAICLVVGNFPKGKFVCTTKSYSVLITSVETTAQVAFELIHCNKVVCCAHNFVL
jgi:hypothetical protein